ncbi:VIT1/CCC1 transporter family protein [Starkeya sp. ORNL1]|uniref:VIT1/CCC1 transporter family protein n=1 Tax=Starkeya sp. ORNL1 TaxID=2709380 RepID=UPI001FEE7C92|nr:VIT1/CCC1 transporter family protein [Starkeya sp. ORNL1]
MTPAEDDPAAEIPGETSAIRNAASRRVLDPVSRASEILFGLIMVLTFTLSLAAAEAGRADVRAVLIGLLGCNLAWAIIDAVMYLMGVRGERGLAHSTLQAIRSAGSPAEGRAIVAGDLPPAVRPALTTRDLERIRLHLASLPADSVQVRLGREDYLGALCVFLLVFLCLFPVAAPFILLDDVTLALRISNAVAVAMLFLTGFTFGRQVGRPWRTGLLMVVIGTALVAVAITLGG